MPQHTVYLLRREVSLHNGCQASGEETTLVEWFRHFFFLQAPLALARIIDGGMLWYGDESPASIARCMIKKSSGS